MLVKCQRTNEEIRDGLPGHGHQEVLCRFGRPERVMLECGCHLPLAWLPTLERLAVLENVPPPNIRTRIGTFKDMESTLKRLQELQAEGSIAVQVVRRGGSN
jgi:hypothetical protein